MKIIGHEGAGRVTLADELPITRFRSYLRVEHAV